MKKIKGKKEDIRTKQKSLALDNNAIKRIQTEIQTLENEIKQSFSQETFTLDVQDNFKNTHTVETNQFKQFIETMKKKQWKLRFSSWPPALKTILNEKGNARRYFHTVMADDISNTEFNVLGEWKEDNQGKMIIYESKDNVDLIDFEYKETERIEKVKNGKDKKVKEWKWIPTFRQKRIKVGADTKTGIIFHYEGVV